jgi:diguanylate cyclase (GGDEF)-like protein
VALGVYAFAASFMQTRVNAPFMHRIFTGAILFTALATLAGLVFPATLAVTAIVADAGLLIGILACTATAIVCVRRGVRSARFFLIGFMGLFVGGIIKIVADDFGSITSTAHFYGVELGVSFDAVILALGLADRIRGEISGRERAQALAVEHERSAYTDALTSVPNRRRFDERLRAEWNRVCRHGGSVALVMIDIDRFKPYNDVAGHLAGDECLKLIATTMMNHVKREGEVFARYGGEEFAVILPGSTLDEAVSLGERMALAVDELQIQHPAGGNVTVSAGIALRHGTHPSDVELLIEDADASLYHAKHSGGNCAVCLGMLGPGALSLQSMHRSP